MHWQPASVFLPGKFHGQRSLWLGYSPGCKELDLNEQQSTQTHTGMQSAEMHLLAGPLSVPMVCLFLCQFRTVVTTSANILPSLSPGTYSDLIPSCQPFSCSQGFGAPDLISKGTLPISPFPTGALVPESQSWRWERKPLGPAGQRA